MKVADTVNYKAHIMVMFIFQLPLPKMVIIQGLNIIQKICQKRIISYLQNVNLLDSAINNSQRKELESETGRFIYL